MGTAGGRFNRITPRSPRHRNRATARRAYAGHTPVAQGELPLNVLHKVHAFLWNAAVTSDGASAFVDTYDAAISHRGDPERTLTIRLRDGTWEVRWRFDGVESEPTTEPLTTLTDDRLAELVTQLRDDALWLKVSEQRRTPR